MSDPTLPQVEGPLPLAAEPLTGGRVTVVENLYYQQQGGPPSTATGDTVRFSRETQSDEQPYERRVVIRESWTPLDHGWIDRCGMLLVRNDEGRFAIQPTDEQREAMSRRVVEVSFAEKRLQDVSERVCILIPPQESCRFYPADTGQIILRCREGGARCTLYLIPE